MEPNSEDNYVVIKKNDKEVTSDEVSLSLILEDIFEKYKALSANINLTDRYNYLKIVLSQTPLRFRFTTSGSVTMRNESLDYLIRLLEGTEKPILKSNSYNLLSKE